MIDLETLTQNWRSKARYTVYRIEGYASQRSEIRTILHSDLPYEEAMASVRLAEQALRLEPGYRPEVMSRPLIGMKLNKSAMAIFAKN